MPYTLFAPAQYQQSGAGATLSNSTTPTDISASPQYVLPAPTVTSPGQTLHFFAAGVYGTTGSAPSLILGPYQATSGTTGVGGTLIAGTKTSAGLTASLSGATWLMEVWTTFVTVGASATAYSNGYVLLQTSTTTGAASIFSIANGTPSSPQSGWDTQANILLTVGATFGTANAANTITCNQFTIRLLN